MTDWRKPCEHGWYDKHRYFPNEDRYYETCPGGTAADLEREAVAIVGWCSVHELPHGLKGRRCHSTASFLIPIPDVAEE